MIIAYTLVCTCVWGVLQSLSEMTIAFPVSGNYIDYADRWVDPALAFGSGFAEWLGSWLSNIFLHNFLMLTKTGWTSIVAAEAGFFSVLISYWAGNSFPMAATSTHTFLSIRLDPNLFSSYYLLRCLLGHLPAPEQGIRLV